jgi:uncharacterized membrane protein YjgN (DUF898 family)
MDLSSQNASPAPAAAHHPVGALVDPTPAFSFTGTGAAYFRIWIVNVVLSVLTLGIFSAWAKVRREQFFHRNARVAGHAFDYHANPISILKGRLLVALVFVVWQLLINVLPPLVSLVLPMVFLFFVPALVQASLRFRMSNTSWRGIRFQFSGGVEAAFGVFVGWPLLNVLTLGLLTPLIVKKAKEYVVGNAWLGTTPFSLRLSAGPFYLIYLVALGLVLACYAVPGTVAAVTLMPDPEALKDSAGMMAMLAAVYLVMVVGSFVVRGYVEARTQDLVWNNVVLGPHRFMSDLSPRQLAQTYLTNLLLIVLTLGLYYPFAAVKLAKLRFEALTLIPGERLDTFLASQQAPIGAFGEEASDMLDVGIGA